MFRLKKGRLSCTSKALHYCKPLDSGRIRHETPNALPVTCLTWLKSRSINVRRDEFNLIEISAESLHLGHFQTKVCGQPSQPWAPKISINIHIQVLELRVLTFRSAEHLPKSMGVVVLSTLENQAL
ncbi:hypothetical protein KIL84_022283 [Mauremys mutica]|uniref:Uncharacterized protein n=1 Tax=Mauremys mutica TaxID=74926 RepID=A0A9D3X9Z5_9SAUR|nr:hypothetical protein KIL84_022283 [Mauremys mutica]